MAIYNGTTGDDESVLTFTAIDAEGDDFLYGFDGADILEGFAGSDIIEGGEGDDFLYGFDRFAAAEGQRNHRHVAVIVDLSEARDHLRRQ